MNYLKKYYRYLFLIFANLCLINNIFSKSSLKIIDVACERLEFDKKNKTLKAMGDVSVVYTTSSGKQYLTCDLLLYDQNTHRIKALSNGIQNVELTNFSGDVLKTHSLDISDSFEDGVLETITLKRPNNATLSGEKAVRDQDATTTLTKASYTSCNFCNLKKPLWELKAQEVIHNTEEQSIVYRDAVLEIKDIPVFYTPYFEHPDPTLKKKSGILLPVFRHNNDLGYTFGLPVYYVIDDQQDMTLTPIILTRQTGVIQGEYRNRFYNGKLFVDGSFTRSKNLPYTNKTIPIMPDDAPQFPRQERWHLNFIAAKDITENQRIQANIRRASDTTYLTRYGLVADNPFIHTNNNLRSDITWEYFGTNSYASVENLFFQTDAQSTTPFVLPHAQFQYQSKMPKQIGGVWNYQSDMILMFRDQEILGVSGTRMYRLSQGVSFEPPLVLPFGHLLSFGASTRVDFYIMKKYFENALLPQSLQVTQSHRHIRFFPEFHISWQWPLRSAIFDLPWILTPKAMIVSSPISINNRHISNEDSQAFEVDETRLFLPNRFDGFDRVDPGTRFIVGLQNDVKFNKNRSISFFIGQSHRLDKQHVTNPNTGENTKHSDLVMRLVIKPFHAIRTRHRAAYNTHVKTFRFMENGIVLGDKKFTVDLGHAFLNKLQTDSGYYVSQINGQISSQITDNWYVSFGQIRNLKKFSGGTSLSTFMALTYDDECFTSEVGVYKSSQRDRDIKPEFSILFKINFKTLTSLTFSRAPLYPRSPLGYGLE